MTPLRWKKPFTREEKKLIPDSIEQLRKKNWKIIQHQEHVCGDGLKRALAIQRISLVFKTKKARSQMTQKLLHNQAKAIYIMLTMLTDEFLMAKGRQNVPAREWNKAYLSFLLASGRIIPKELQREIFRQIREE